MPTNVIKLFRSDSIIVGIVHFNHNYIHISLSQYNMVQPTQLPLYSFGMPACVTAMRPHLFMTTESLNHAEEGN